MRVLLERGADINQGADDGCTPLMIASQEGHEEIVRVLLERGADVNQGADEIVRVLLERVRLP